MSELLDKVKYEVSIERASSDHRRIVYDVAKVTGGLAGKWFPHGMIAVKNRFELGGHYHDYDEIFFTPINTFNFRLVDINNFETKKYILHPGSRLLIPKEIGHVAVCDDSDVRNSSNGLLISYGNALYNPKRTFPCSEKALEALAMIK